MGKKGYRFKYTVEIVVSGGGDKEYFKALSTRKIKELQCDCVSAGVDNDSPGRPVSSAYMKIKSSKIIGCEEITNG